MTALDTARRVADAVLYEGYLLYPYRASSSKNQVRWQYGVLGPLGAVDAMVGEDPGIYVECIVQPTGADAAIGVILRFLQTQWRTVERATDETGDSFEPVDELTVGTAKWVAWHEAVEQEVVIPGMSAQELLDGRELDLAIAGGETVELLRDETGIIVGRLVRERFPLVGRLTVSATPMQTTPYSLLVHIDVENVAELERSVVESRTVRRDLAARQSFVGTHLLLSASDSVFVSLVDPPGWAAAAVERCSNERCWPFLVGTKGEDEQVSDLLFGSPIILGDYPEIAAESPGQLFDSAEIDEILTLRIMTMTDEEKAAARGTDPRAAAIIDRSDEMSSETLGRLHGVLRDLEPDFPTWFNEQAEAAVTPETDVIMIDGQPVSKGTRVLLRPSRRADAHDMFLAGQVAVVRRIDLDVDGQTHVAVLLEDDPARDLHESYGRYYYFGAEEVVPLVGARGRPS